MIYPNINSIAATCEVTRPKFSRATTYALPDFVYVAITSRYENVITKSMKRITAINGGKIVNAANPNAGISATKICSPPYAEDEMQSEERIP